MAVSSSHVVCHGVSKYFGSVAAVDDLNLTIERGSFTTLLGPSGCGKTTTLRMIAGFYEPDAGDITIDGKSQKGLPPYRRDVSIVFQDYALFPHMTVFENVSYGLKLRRTPADERQKRVDRVLGFLGLDRLKKRYPHEMSGGQQQRVALARSIVMEPQVLLMDEPLSNLDAKLRIRVRAELKEIQRTLGITTIYVTHDQDEALSLSDRVAVMSDGRLQQYSDPWTLYHEPANRFVADFVGYANFVPATRKASSDGGVLLSVLGKELRCRVPSHAEPMRAPGSGEVVAMVRPEWFAVEGKAGAAGDSAQVSWQGRIETSSFLGSFVRLWVRVEGSQTPLVVDTEAKQREGFAPGSEVQISLAHDQAVMMDSGSSADADEERAPAMKVG